MSLLQTANLRKSFGDTRAVDGIDLSIDKGEFISLIGANGAGKTTLVNLVSAYLKPDDGDILFQGQNINLWSPKRRIKAGIARSFQLVNLFDDLSARENVSMSLFSRDEKSGRISSMADKDIEVRNEAQDVLHQFGLKEKSEITAGELSHGERKLLDVAVAYALRPTLLFLDEPTSGVSSRDKNQIMDTISSVVRRGGITAAIVEHDMDVVFKYSERIIAMHEGMIIADGSPDEIRNNESVIYNLIGAEVEA